MSQNRKLHRLLTQYLKKAENFFHIDSRYIAVSGFWMGLSRAGLLISSFILTIGFANLLPKEEYGIYRYILTLTAIAGTLSFTGMPTTVISGAARGVKGILTWGVRTKLKWSILSVGVSLAIALYYLIKGNTIFAASIAIAGLCTPLIESLKLYGSFLSGKAEFRKNTLYGVRRKIIPIALLLATMYLTDNVLILISVFFLTSTLTLYTVYRRVRKEFPEKEDASEYNFHFAKHLSVMNVYSDIAGYIDKILVFQFLGSAQLAVYLFATLPISQLQGVLRMSKTLLIPKLAKRDIGALKKSIPKRSFYLLLLLVPVVVIYVLIAPYLYSIFFPQYTEAVFYSQLFACALIFFPVILTSQTLVAHARTKELWILTAILPTIRIIALVVLIPLYGITGAIVAILIHRAFSYVLGLVALSRLPSSVH